MATISAFRPCLSEKTPSKAAVPTVKPDAPARTMASSLATLLIDPAITTGLSTAEQTSVISSSTSPSKR